MLIKKSGTSIIRRGIRETHDSEAKRKIIMLNTFLFLGFFLLLIMGLIALIQNSVILASTDFIMAFLFGCSLIYLHKTGNEPLISSLSVSLVFCFFSVLFFTGGVNATAFMWLYCFPLFTLYLLGQKKGLITIVLLFVTCSAYLTVDLLTDFINVYDINFTVRFLPTLFSVSTLAFLIERSRAITKEDLQKIQETLEDQVVQRTSELEKLNKKLLNEIEERRASEDKKVRLEKKLKQSEKLELVGKLAGGVAHDLNNVLSGIVSYPDLILYKLPNDSKIRLPLENIKRSGLRASAIIEDLLSLARRSITNKENVYLNTVISDYFESPEFYSLQSKNSNIDVKQILCSELPPIMGSPVHLGKIVMNLVGNSFDAISGPGEITISTGIKSCLNKNDVHTDEPIDHIVMSVSDSGEGMSPKVIEKIFEPFYTSKVMGRQSGTGLGMTIVSGVVEDHNGFIDIESTINKGSTFKVFFPASIDEDNKKSNLRKIIEPGHNQRVLIVDDEQEQIDVCSSILSTLNYDVYTANSGEEAIKMLENTEVDLVLLDMIMDPGIDGLETFKKIKIMHPYLPTILVSGYAEVSKIEEAFNLGVKSWVKKPYTLSSLTSTVNREIRR